jgi:hypothetical protein
MFADQPIDEFDKAFTGSRKDKLLCPCVPVEFEAGSKRGDPNLANGRVGSDNEPGAGIFEENVEGAALLVDFEGRLLVFFAGNEMAFERIERGFGGAAEFLFVWHGDSVARPHDNSPAASETGVVIDVALTERTAPGGKIVQTGSERLKTRLFLPMCPLRSRRAEMEIGPIPGIRALPAIKPARNDQQPPAVFDVDGVSKPTDNGHQGNGRKAAGAEEYDDNDLMVEDDIEVESETPEEAPPRQVDYFA